MLSIVFTPEQMMLLHEKVNTLKTGFNRMLFTQEELLLKQYIKDCAQIMNSDRIPSIEIKIPQDVTVLTEPIEQVGLKINSTNIIVYEVVKWRLENAV
jgi:hypothetical protein